MEKTSRTEASSAESLNSHSSCKLSSGDENHFQREWVCRLLTKYLTKIVFESTGRKDATGSPVTSEIKVVDKNGNSGNGGTAEPNEIKRHNMTSKEIVKDGEFETKFNAFLYVKNMELVDETALGDDRFSYLTRILSAAVAYSINEQSDHFIQWLVKVPSKSPDERNFARMTNVYRRETMFYSEILQDIKLWLELNPIHCLEEEEDLDTITLNVPLCYYAVAQDLSLENESNGYGFPSSEFTLILDDLRPHGFGKRHFGTGLTVVETMEALREIAKVHAVSWVMAEHSHEKALNWPDMLKWENIHAILLGVVQRGFQHARQLLQTLIQDEERYALLCNLLDIESRLPEVLKKLLKPLPPPAVTSLIHMDFWTDNLLFRENKDENVAEQDANAKSSSCEKHSKSDSVDELDIDCMIVDWQMVSLGRVSHDLGILMITSLDANIRRNYGIPLLQFYYDVFQNIVRFYKLEIPFEMSDLIQQYTESCLLAVLLAVGRLELVTSEESTIDRFFSALEDLKEEDLI